MTDIKTARSIAETIIEAVDCTPSVMTFTELKELFQHIIDQTEISDDFTIDETYLPTGEVRLIDGDAIDQIWTDELIKKVKECNELDNLPEHIENNINWDGVAEDCKGDGMGYHFAGYDHEEYEVSGWHVFRTN